MDTVVYALLNKRKANLVDGKVPDSELPSYVDDIEEYANASQFPQPGEQGKIYVDLNTGYTYRWSGTRYTQVGGQTFEHFNPEWTTTSTTSAFCSAVNADEEAKVGMAYLGGASFTDLPFNGNGDIVAEVLQGPNNSKSIHLVMTSGDVAPYLWHYTWWNNGSDTSGWIAFANDNAVVHKTGNETVAGDKNLTGNTTLVRVNSKTLPANPPDTGTYTFQSVDGVFSWIVPTDSQFIVTDVILEER